MRTPLGTSLGFQLHAELHLPLEKQDLFLIAAFSSVFQGGR